MFNKSDGSQRKLQAQLARTSQAANLAFFHAEYPLETEPAKLALPNFVNFFLRATPITHEGSVHHRFVLVLNFATAGVIVADDAWVNFQKGQAFLIFPYQYHYFCNFASQKIDWVFLTFEVSQPESLEAMRNRLLTLTSEVMIDIQRLCDLCHENPRPIPETRHQIALLSALVLHGLLKLPSQEVAHAMVAKEAAHELVESVGRYIREQMSQGVTVKKLAEHLALSESHLRYSFRAATGTSIGQYTRRMRMLQAMSLLHTTSLTVSQVAKRCGFNSLFAFSRAFSRHTGVSPMAYRRYHQRL